MLKLLELVLFWGAEKPWTKFRNGLIVMIGLFLLMFIFFGCSDKEGVTPNNEKKPAWAGNGGNGNGNGHGGTTTPPAVEDFLPATDFHITWDTLACGVLRVYHDKFPGTEFYSYRMNTGAPQCAVTDHDNEYLYYRYGTSCLVDPLKTADITIQAWVWNVAHDSATVHVSLPETVHTGVGNWDCN